MFFRNTGRNTELSHLPRACARLGVAIRATSPENGAQVPTFHHTMCSGSVAIRQTPQVHSASVCPSESFDWGWLHTRLTSQTSSSAIFACAVHLETCGLTVSVNNHLVPSSVNLAPSIFPCTHGLYALTSHVLDLNLHRLLAKITCHPCRCSQLVQDPGSTVREASVNTKRSWEGEFFGTTR